MRAQYYTALAEDQEYSSIRPLVDWLDYNGYTMVTKPTKEFTDAFGRRKIKGNMDIELTVDAMRLVEQLDHVVLFTGDGDFRALVAAMQLRGRRVSVVSTLQTQPPMVADELRRQADQFIDLADLEDQICRDPGDPSGARAARADQRAGGRAAGAHAPVAATLDYPDDEDEAADAESDPALWPFPGRRDGLRQMDRAAEAPRDCPLCPRLAPFRAANRATSPPGTMAPSRPSAGRTGTRAAADRRAGAGAERRQPHRAALHRRLCRRPALRDAARASALRAGTTRRGPTTG